MIGRALRPDERVGLLMAAVLLVPVLTTASNLFSTARGRWSLLADDFGLRFAAAGVGLLIAWAVLQALSSERSVARVLGLTAWEAGLRHLALYGVFSSFAFAALYHLLPRISGRAWYSRRAASIHFWATIVGVGAGALVAFASGLVQGATWLAFGAVGDASRFDDAVQHAVVAVRGYQALGLVAFGVVALAQYLFAWNAYRTALRGEPLPAAQAAPVAVGAPS